jgi:glycosyltransferase involved in cell wall biosynthesis
VLPTDTDSFGLVLVESLACGTPIVVTDRGAPSELVTPEVGAVCRAGDPASLADALTSGLELSQQPDTAARCRAHAAGFDWDAKIAPKLEEIYASITANESGSGATA